MKKTAFIIVIILSLICIRAASPGAGRDLSVSYEKERGWFPLAAEGKTCKIVVDSSDFRGVIRAGSDLRSDIERVTGISPLFSTGDISGSKYIIIAGTAGESSLINSLIRSGKINTAEIRGRWESYIIQTVDRPFPGVKKALVIAGSDKRGTIYGIYGISRLIGVSPWYWWADVVPARHNSIYISPGRFIQGEPSVKYRGIFLNDEAPALTNWVASRYGMVKPSDNPPVPPGVADYGHEFYSRIFELLLRLRGNYLWPAMWNNAFNEDDSLNASLADEYGIVMGTSHQEPMLRAQKEWDRRYRNTLGYWNYPKHADVLHDFWREGIRRNRSFESIITMGLRGADDTEMAPGGPEANIKVLEGIIDVQRNIISEETNRDVTTVPQMWCLYKEVQDYYDAGLRVPDDITLLWAEDNWGNIRRLPSADERKRSGGAGVYYHFDYHGGPRSYQWINTNPLPKIWDQMALAKEYGADRIWIVNVGHFKGYELPLDFFMSLAWDTGKFTGGNCNDYNVTWAAEQFGALHAGEIGHLLSEYARYNGRRKPELLSPYTYSLTDYNEAGKVVYDYRNLAAQAEKLSKELPAELQDAFYELVLFPVKASATVNELYYAAGRNDLYARQGRAATNDMADSVMNLFIADTSLMGYYNRTLAGGKWNHFMDQAHLGYLGWADPPVNSLRAINIKRIELSEAAEAGVAIEGSGKTWPGSPDDAILPPVDNYKRQERYIDIFNKGKQPFAFTAEADVPWILLSSKSGTVNSETRLKAGVDWSSVPGGRSTGNIIIRAAGKEVTVSLPALNSNAPEKEGFRGFVESEGCVSIEAEHFSGKTSTGNSSWEMITGYGKTSSAMRAVALPDTPPAAPGADSPCLYYDIYMFTADTVSVRLTLSPSLNFIHGRDIRIGISFDDEAPQTVTVVPGGYKAQNGNRDWEKSVEDNARYISARHLLNHPGKHTLKVWMTDPGICLEKIVIDAGGVKPSYLGPPESCFIDMGKKR